MINDTRDLTRSMKLSKLQWIDVSFNNDNPYEQTKMFCDIRLVFFEKRKYWRSMLALCSAREAPSVYMKFLHRMALEELSKKKYQEEFALVESRYQQSREDVLLRRYREGHEVDPDNEDEALFNNENDGTTTLSGVEVPLDGSPSLTPNVKLNTHGSLSRRFLTSSSKVMSAPAIMTQSLTSAYRGTGNKPDSCHGNKKNDKSGVGFLKSPRSNTGKNDVCWLCLLPKDLIRLVAAAAYPWPKSDKAVLGFIYG